MWKSRKIYRELLLNKPRLFRIKRAKIILAEAEYLAAAKLKEAGEILKAELIVLRYLETLTETAKEKNTTILFPVEVLGMLKKLQN